MNTLLDIFLRPGSADIVQLGLLFLRASIGLIMVFHGFPKLLAGPNTWVTLGSAMENFGIHFLPIVWGLACALTEFFGGVSLVLGLGVRMSCIFLIFAMSVALVMHLTLHDSYDVYSHAITLIIIFITFFIIGSGTFSLDYYLTRP
ncbi:MAG: DoxX family protein [Candidatus Babeliaceae bacterium]|nr:DoxX family protein [Candidatus Babeliaceae bacterium]